MRATSSSILFINIICCCCCCCWINWKHAAITSFSQTHQSAVFPKSQKIEQTNKQGTKWKTRNIGNNSGGKEEEIRQIEWEVKERKREIQNRWQRKCELETKTEIAEWITFLFRFHVSYWLSFGNMTPSSHLFYAHVCDCTLLRSYPVVIIHSL